MPELIACPIWKSPAYLTGGSLDDGARVLSPRAGGVYRITREAIDDLPSLTISEATALTTWLVDQRRFGIPEPELTTDIVATVLSSPPRRLSFAERRERLFRGLMERDIRPGQSFPTLTQPAMTPEEWLHPDTLLAWMGVNTEFEGRGLIEMLQQQGYLHHGQGGVCVTAKGFEYLDTLHHNGANSRQAFVAMWFAEEMKEAWRLGFAPGIRDAGYDPFRIDGLEHNGKIDDAIVAEIKRSRFLIADFTCGGTVVDGKFEPNPRGGVYYEAGLAHGLSMEVIFTCREDRMAYLHFDTRQFAHIVWKTPVDLRSQLYNRIAATVKEAPGAPGRGNGAVDRGPGSQRRKVRLA